MWNESVIHFFFKCNRYASNTSITLCGCATEESPAFKFFSAETSLSCLSTGSATPFAKRTQVFSKNIGDYLFTCNNNSLGNPFQDCINAQGAFCNPSYISGNPTRLSECRSAVDTITRGLSSLWKNVRINCGKWSFDGRPAGLFNSSNCENANNALKSAYYILPDTSKQYVDIAFINSVNAGLWAIV
jgi:hypothetical protein